MNLGLQKKTLPLFQRYTKCQRNLYLFVNLVEQIRVTVSKGETVELSCRKLGAKKPTDAEWKFQKSRGQSTVRVTINRWIMPRYRRRFAVKSSNDSAQDVLDFSLIIHRVICADSGVYICLITDQSNEMQRFVHLDVTGESSDDDIQFSCRLILSVGVDPQKKVEGTPPLPSLSPLLLEIGPLNPAMVSGEALHPAEK